jgi:hypothetical protein
MEIVAANPEIFGKEISGFDISIVLKGFNGNCFYIHCYPSSVIAKNDRTINSYLFDQSVSSPLQTQNLQTH